VAHPCSALRILFVSHNETWVPRGDARQVILGDDADRIRGIGTALAELVGVSGSVD
jgi:hypothetical protein